MRYKPIGTAPNETVEDLAKWLTDELNKVAATMASLDATIIRFVQLNEEPARLSEGMVVNADGTNWNPGSGVGLYIYRSAAWVKLG